LGLQVVAARRDSNLKSGSGGRGGVVLVCVDKRRGGEATRLDINADAGQRACVASGVQAESGGGPSGVAQIGGAERQNGTVGVHVEHTLIANLNNSRAVSINGQLSDETGLSSDGVDGLRRNGHRVGDRGRVRNWGRVGNRGRIWGRGRDGHGAGDRGRGGDRSRLRGGGWGAT
jgi:hypothetical protein